MTRKQLKELIETQLEILAGLNRAIGENLDKYWNR
jgi:hypothetical protein